MGRARVRRLRNRHRALDRYGSYTFGPYPADQVRTDVGAAYPGYGDAHGYTVTFTPPQIYSCYYALVVTGVNAAAGADATVGGRMCS
ncbi:hypothetical protein ACFVHB_36120 [Kitasatospora sp. NPDC127111]|uniref:hypothetical protein n=1 Tax=Kitasatospora sp. NPDC127111 TaxID=3345363 RepID=UPI00363A5B43